MERVTAYYGAQLRDVDLLNIGQKTMVALAKLSEAVLGSATATTGLAVTPGTGLSVSVAIGQIYQIEPLEATPWSGLPANTNHFIVKQGLLMDPATVTGFSAPSTAGQSINYLLEAQYQDVDGGAAVLNFYNAANPSGPPYSGPGNLSTPSNTFRRGAVVFQVVAGTAATTGTQTTPAPDSGWVGLAVVTIANGQSSIVTGNIAAYVGNPYIPTTLPALPGNIQDQAWVAWQDTGTANNYVITPYPPIASAPAGTRFVAKIANANTGTSANLTVNSVTMPIVMNDGTAIGPNYIAANMMAGFVSDGARWQLETPSTAAYAVAPPDYGSGLAYQIGWLQ